MQIFSEGQVHFYAENNQLRSAKVFFNPFRRIDRDLNVLFIESLGKHNLRGIDAFGASGVRGLRLAKETGCFSEMIINDIKTEEVIKKNISLNRLGRICRASNINAFDLDSLGKFDYVDIDPFGSPAGFLMVSIDITKLGGVIAITATDTAALYGKANRACLRKYGSLSFKSTYFNETGLRILLKKAEETANLKGFSIEPLFFDVRRHYVRAYLKLISMRENEKGYIYQCSRCINRTLSPEERCDYCGAKMVRTGPLWLGKIFDRKIVDKMYLLSIKEEKFSNYREYLNILRKEIETPTYYTTDSLASLLKTNEKKIEKFDARTVFNPKGFRKEGSLQDVIKYYNSIQ